MVAVERSTSSTPRDPPSFKSEPPEPSTTVQDEAPPVAKGGLQAPDHNQQRARGDISNAELAPELEPIDDDSISRKLSFSETSTVTASGSPSVPVTSLSVTSDAEAHRNTTKQESAPKRDPFAYDNAYTNFGAHIDVHRWSCVGTPEEVQQYIVGPGRAGTTDENGWTCLHWACYAGQAETIRTLEKQTEVDLNAQTKTGDTALHILARSSNVAIFQLLLDLGADGNIKNDRGKMPYQLSRGETIFRTLTESSMPKPRSTISAARGRPATSQPGADLVGKWVLIEFNEEKDSDDEADRESSDEQGESCWYRGRVESYDSNKHRHRLRWEDGSTTWVEKLQKDEYRLAPKPSRRESSKLRSPGSNRKSSSTNQLEAGQKRISPKRPENTKSSEASKNGSAGDGWTSTEDSTLIQLQRESPDMDWDEKTRILGTGRTAKACQTRWLRHLSERADDEVDSQSGPQLVSTRGTKRNSSSNLNTSSSGVSGDQLQPQSARPEKRVRMRDDGREEPEVMSRVPSRTRIPRAKLTKFQDTPPPVPLATAADQEVLVSQAADEIFGSKDSDRVLSEIWPPQLSLGNTSAVGNGDAFSEVGEVRDRLLVEHRRLRTAFEDGLRRELQRGPVLRNLNLYGRQSSPRAAAVAATASAPSRYSDGRARVPPQGPTAADAVAHVKAQFANLQAEVLQRQALELLTLVARVHLSR